MTELIKKFYSQEPKGKCTDSNFEFGNLHRNVYKCEFCSIEGNCHFLGDKCDHREGQVENIGWRTS